MINGLPTELLGSLVSNAASFVIGQVTESTSWKEWKSKNGLTERENNFLEVYVEAIIEFAQKDKPKFLLDFFRNESVINAIHDHWYDGNSHLPFFNSLQNLATHFTLSNQLGTSSTVENEFGIFEELFRKYVDRSASVSERKEFDEIKMLVKDLAKEKNLTLADLNFNFKRSKTTWLKERYIPSLHSKGQIQNKIEEVLFSSNFVKEQIEDIESVFFDLEKTIAHINLFIEKTDNHELDSELIIIAENLQLFQKPIDRIIEQLKLNNEVFSCEEIKEVKVWETRLKLEYLKIGSISKNVRVKLVRLLEKIHQLSLEKFIKEYPLHYHPHNLIILGDPGSGKTHGLAFAVEERLNQNLPAIIIEAQSVSPTNWKSIFQEWLGLANDWNQEEIFEQFNLLGEASPDNKMLICIDGLDEVADYQKWKNRIDELKDFLTKYPQLRFVVACRTYVPNWNPLGLDYNDNGYGNRIHSLIKGTDVPMEKLAHIYFKEYDVNITDAPWIIYTIKSPLELRLFCQEYQGQKISPDAKTNLVSIIKNKINRVEEEIFSRVENDWVKEDQVPFKVLIFLARKFSNSQNQELERNQLFQEILDSDLKGQINRPVLSNVMQYFCNHGLLLRFRVESEVELEPYQYHYRFPYQSLTELIIANTFIDEIIKKGRKNIPDLFLDNDRILELTSISLLDESDKMVGENDLWTDDLDEHKLDVLKLRALSNAGFETIKKYKDWVTQKFLESEKYRYLIMEFLIIPSARIPNHPIGARFVHDLLNEFENVFTRDLIWSGPDYPKEGYYRHGRLLIYYVPQSGFSTTSWDYILKDSDRFDGLPLLFAWSLTTVENIYREHCRKELCRWAWKNPNEFLKLLELTFECDAPQMTEDLALVLLGVASLLKKDESSSIINLAHWSLKTIFSETGLKKYRSPMIRQGGRAIVERAISFDLLSSIHLEKVRPPYNLSFEFLDLNSAVLENFSEEFHPIEHDLAWYVIEKSFKGFLPYQSANDDFPKHIEDFFKKYIEKFEIEDLFNHKFGMAAAIKFIYELGYNRDNASWASATHGGKSAVATFEEKYTWLAVHHILGYLSDYLPFNNSISSHEKYENIIDYNEAIQVPNPAQLVIEKLGNLSKNIWVTPNELSPKTDFNEEKLIDDLKNWVHNSPFPNIADWLHFNDEQLSDLELGIKKSWYTLSNYTKLATPDNKVSNSLSITTCFIKKEFLNDFIAIASNQYPFYHDFPLDLKSSPKASVYVSPRDVIWMDWIDDEYEKVVYTNDKDEPFQIYYGVSELTDNTIEESDKSYRIPSRFTRKLLDISDGDGIQYFNPENELMAINNKVGKGYKDSQNLLLVDAEKFQKSLDEKGFTKFWVISIYREVTMEERERLGFFTRHMTFWMAWNDGTKYVFKKIKDEDYKPLKK